MRRVLVLTAIIWVLAFAAGYTYTVFTDPDRFGTSTSVGNGQVGTAEESSTNGSSSGLPTPRSGSDVDERQDGDVGASAVAMGEVRTTLRLERRQAVSLVDRNW